LLSGSVLLDSEERGVPPPSVNTSPNAMAGALGRDHGDIDGYGGVEPKRILKPCANSASCPRRDAGRWSRDRAGLFRIWRKNHVRRPSGGSAGCLTGQAFFLALWKRKRCRLQADTHGDATIGEVQHGVTCEA